MQIARTLVCLLLTLSFARSEPLSDVDRKALLGNLNNLRETANSRIDARFHAAIESYRTAMMSNDAAMDLYLKCIRKVNFEDQQKKITEFNEWKRNDSDQLNDTGFRMALRYQLRWLVLTLKASSEKADRNAIAAEAQEIIDSLFQDISRMSTEGRILQHAVSSTVFAKAYDIEISNKDALPQSPIQISQIYESVLLPPLRKASSIAALRAAWIKRIQQETLAVETWDDSARENGKGKKNKEFNEGKAAKSVAVEKFATEVLPELQWQMELDLFHSGDEKASAKRMLDHIEKHLSHKSSRKWSDELKTLLTPAASPGTETQTSKRD